MISLTIGTNTEKKHVIVSAEDTLQKVLTDNNVNTSSSAIHLNGSLIPGCDLAQTFTELGVPDESEAMLIAVTKSTSAFI